MISYESQESLSHLIGIIVNTRKKCKMNDEFYDNFLIIIIN